MRQTYHGEMTLISHNVRSRIPSAQVITNDGREFHYDLAPREFCQLAIEVGASAVHVSFIADIDTGANPRSIALHMPQLH
jgi:hypothetical protein